jgi:hypothetical protein
MEYRTPYFKESTLNMALHSWKRVVSTFDFIVQWPFQYYRGKEFDNMFSPFVSSCESV